MPHTAAGGKVPDSALIVLVVEDNAAMRALIRSLAEQVASTVDECESAEKALDMYARVRPACVLMDIRLSRMDGLAATRAIRRLDPGARVIIVTEYGDPAYRRAAEAVGAHGFVLKENLLALPGLLRSFTRPREPQRAP